MPLPLRSWLILFGTLNGLIYIDLGIYALHPEYRYLCTGVAILIMTLVYARLTGLSWWTNLIRLFHG